MQTAVHLRSRVSAGGEWVGQREQALYPSYLCEAQVGVDFDAVIDMHRRLDEASFQAHPVVDVGRYPFRVFEGVLGDMDGQVVVGCRIEEQGD